MVEISSGGGVGIVAGAAHNSVEVVAVGSSGAGECRSGRGCFVVVGVVVGLLPVVAVLFLLLLLLLLLLSLPNFSR